MMMINNNNNNYFKLLLNFFLLLNFYYSLLLLIFLFKFKYRMFIKIILEKIYYKIKEKGGKILKLKPKKQQLKQQELSRLLLLPSPSSLRSSICFIINNKIMCHHQEILSYYNLDYCYNNNNFCKYQVTTRILMLIAFQQYGNPQKWWRLIVVVGMVVLLPFPSKHQTDNQYQHQNKPSSCHHHPSSIIRTNQINQKTTLTIVFITNP